MRISGHRIIRFNKESIGAASGRAPQGRGAPLWLLSLLNLIILCPDIRILCLFGQIQQIFYEIPINPLKAISRNLAPSGAGFLPSTVGTIKELCILLIFVDFRYF